MANENPGPNDLLLGNSHRNPDYYQTLAEQIMRDDCAYDDIEAIERHRAMHQPHLPMESFTSNVQYQPFSYGARYGPQYSYPQPQHQQLQTHQYIPSSIASSSQYYSLDISASETPPPTLSIGQPHYDWDDTGGNTFNSDHSIRNDPRQYNAVDSAAHPICTSNIRDDSRQYNAVDSAGYPNCTSNPQNSTSHRHAPSPSTRPSGPTHFSCPHAKCNKDFTNSNHLKKHLCTHVGKRLVCPVCHHRYSRKDTILRHFKQIHRLADNVAQNLADEVDAKMHTTGI